MSDVFVIKEEKCFESDSIFMNKNSVKVINKKYGIFKNLNILGKSRKERRAAQYEAAGNILSSLTSRWDLSNEFKMPGKGAASIVTKALNQVFRNLNDFVTDLTKQTVGLASIAPTMHHISRKVLSAAEILGEKGEEIELSCRSLADGMRTSAASAGEALEKSESIVEEIKRARNLTSTSLDSMTTIDRDMTKLSLAISSLERNSKNISSIIDTISEISETTGLLSLNAFIEAARAGSHGAGFGVIAHEIRQLSGQSGKAALEIKETLLGISELIEHTVVAVGHVKECVASGLDVSKDADLALYGVGIEHSGFHGQLESTLNSVKNQEKAVFRILSRISEIADAGRSGSIESRKLSESADMIRKLAEKQLESAGAFILPQYKKVESVISSIASDPDIEGMTISMNKVITERMALLPYIELVYLTDVNGIQVSANIFRDKNKTEIGSNAVGRDWSSREWFKKVMETKKTCISEIYKSAATDSYCMTFSVPVCRSGYVVGVLGADVNFENLLDI